ncbi:enhancing lycopene biosynthesis protein 2 [Thermonema lapsum]|uniref:Enhancing lycopene biosynthesis protein 2 n=1 Tax=Thermonema lapsum TaxID=28195 RepID=A0A846MRB1_9BACT|nr:isoprenoid biosynthesis glyoxalase ElbB [Thermonema lapsum]NIK74198.1 enhancing lycopene biosynthesis protein 2 [Thermonema lapsum]
MKPKVAVLLSGCGVYDGAEIHEAVCTLLSLQQLGAEPVCVAPNIPQYHVINHLSGEEMPESRNVLIEAARIARGNILDIEQAKVENFDALAMPGGFGVAKNFTTWAFKGPDGDIIGSVKQFIRAFYEAQKPIAAVCMSPTTVAKALEGTNARLKLTIGTTTAASPYDIAGIQEGLRKVGAEPVNKTVNEIMIDEENRLVTSPCYMMEASIVDIYEGVKKTMQALLAMVKEQATA